MLTMRIIEDALQPFSPVARIADGAAQLGGVLLNAVQPGFACLQATEGGVVCQAGEDSLFLPGAELAEAANAIAAEQKHLLDWRREMDRILDAGGSIRELVTAAYPIFQNPIFVTDELDLVCARTHHGFGQVNKEWDYILRHGCMPFERMQGISCTAPFRSHHFGESGPDRPFFYSPPGMGDTRAITYRIPSMRRGVYIGALVIIQTEHPLTEGALHRAELLAEAVKRWAQIGDADSRIQSLDALVRDALHGEPVAWQSLESGLRLRGLRTEALTLALAPCESTMVAASLSRTLEALLDCFCVALGERVVVLFPEDLTRDAQACFHGISGALQQRFGLSGVLTQVRALPQALRQAETALELVDGGVACFDSATAMTFMARVLHTGCAGAGLLHPAVRILQRYDAAHGTEYLRTLHCWLRCERSAVRCLEELHIHRNTLLYRLERLKVLCGEDFSQVASREHLLLSMHLLEQEH